MSGEERSVFITQPIPVTLTLEDGLTRRVIARRMTFAHAQQWDRTWFGFTPDWVDFTDEQKQAFAVDVIKAAFPEPTEGCSPMCICRGNEDLHAILDRLSGERNFEPLDALFAVALEVNRPKAEPRQAALAGGSTLTRQWPGWLLWASRWPLSRISQSNSVHTFLTQPSATVRPGTPRSPMTRVPIWARWRLSSRTSASDPARTSRRTSRLAPLRSAAGSGRSQ